MNHFLANSNENKRFVDSSDFDERLFRGYYAYPFYKGAEDLANWDGSQHEFVLEKGNVLLMIGAASDDIRLTGTIEVL